MFRGRVGSRDIAAREESSNGFGLRAENEQRRGRMNGLNIDFDHNGNVLALLFVFSVVFEIALKPIFHWLLFARHSEGEGAKILITVVAAVLLLSVTPSISCHIGVTGNLIRV